jgi:hypothetical protein
MGVKTLLRVAGKLTVKPIRGAIAETIKREAVGRTADYIPLPSFKRRGNF